MDKQSSLFAYEHKEKSILQKIFLVLFQLVVIGFIFYIMFTSSGQALMRKIGFEQGNFLRIKILFSMIVILFLSYLPTILIFVRRKILWQEAFSIPLAFSIYYIGFTLLGYSKKVSVGFWDYLGIGIFLLGIIMHFLSEYQRFRFKQNPQNKGKLLTTGFWAITRHINYTSDLIWVLGFCLVSRNWWSLVILVFLFVFFYFFNIPEQEKYLSKKYGQQFAEYKQKTKALIPFLL